MNNKSCIFKTAILLMLMILAAILHAGAQSIFERADMDDTLNPAPVVVGEKFLFNIYAYLDNFSPFERSTIISKRLVELGQDTALVRDSLKIVEIDDQHQIHYSDSVIMVISNADSFAIKADREEVAEAYLQLIAKDFIPMFKEFSLRENLFEIAKTLLLLLLIVVVTVILFRILMRLIGMLRNLAAKIKNEYKLGIVVRGFRILTSEQFDKTVSFLIGLLNLIFIVILGYFALYFLLYVIPYTRFIALQLQAYIMRPIAEVGHAILHYLPNLFFIAVVIFVARYLLKFLRYFFDEVKEG